MKISLQDIAHPVEAEFGHFRTLLRASIASEHRTLKPLAQYIIEPRGKMMRPLLGLLIARLHGGAVGERTEAVALLFELLHHATLIHDDVIDEAYTRRGELTAGAMLRSRAAVLVGDFLFGKGLMEAARVGAFAEIQVATHAIELVVEGELRQSENARTLKVGRQEYFDVVGLKTGALIAGVSLGAAISVGADKEQCEAMKQFGDMLGVAFQIRDDILDYTGSPLVTGKALYNDIKERKLTLPLILAIEKGGDRLHVLADLRAGETMRVVDYVERMGGVAAAEVVMREYFDRAMALLAPYPDSEFKRSLELFATYAISRDK